MSVYRGSECVELYIDSAIRRQGTRTVLLYSALSASWSPTRPKAVYWGIKRPECGDIAHFHVLIILQRCRRFLGHGLPVAGFETVQFLECEDLSPKPNPQFGGPGYLSLSGTSLENCPAWVTLWIPYCPPSTRVVPKVMSNFFCMRTGNSRRRRVRW